MTRTAGFMSNRNIASLERGCQRGVRTHQSRLIGGDFTDVRYASLAAQFRSAAKWRDVTQAGLSHCSKKTLFDHLVGTSEQRGRDLQAELLCSFLVYNQLKFGGTLNG